MMRFVKNIVRYILIFIFSKALKKASKAVFRAQSQADFPHTEVMGKVYMQGILWMGILVCWPADPGGESTERTGCNM